MRFCDFAKILYSFMGDGRKPSDFIVSLVDNIMTDPLSDEDAKKVKDCEYNPIASLFENTRNQIYNGKRDIEKKKATFILGRLDKQKFEDCIAALSDDAILSLCEKLKVQGVESTKDDLPQKCADIFAQILTASTIGSKELTPINGTHGDYNLRLLIESKGYCQNYGCNEPLLVMKNGKSLERYNITQISVDKPKDAFDNLIALCPKCHSEYVLAPSENETKRLLEIKSSLMRDATAMESASEVKIEAGIADVIHKIASPPGELIPLNYEPVAVADKIEPQNRMLLTKTLFHVSTYFNYVKEIFKQTSKEGQLRFEAFSAQVHLCYLKERDNGLPQQDIYAALVEWLKTATNGNRDACEIVIAYFVQNCEVFDAITK